MSSKTELYELCDRINLSKVMQGVYLKVEHENDLFYVRIYKGESCENTLLGGGSSKHMLESLRAFAQGLFFVHRYVDDDRKQDVEY